jgi:hypothetical protein
MLPNTDAQTAAGTSSARAIRRALVQALAADFSDCVRKTDVFSTSSGGKVKLLCPELQIRVNFRCLLTQPMGYFRASSSNSK